MTGDRRYEIDKVMFNTKFYGGDMDIAEDIYWMWYDTDEMDDANERDKIYEIVEEYLKKEGIM